MKCFGNRGPTKYVEEPSNNYLCVADRIDSNASRPCDFEFQGARLLHIKECPGLPLQHDACKRLLETREGDLAARANHSKPGDVVSFPITWAIMMSRQSSVTWPPKCSETGMKSKVLEIRPPYEFVPETEVNSDNPRHKPAKDSVIQELSSGKHSAEVIFWARLLHPTVRMVDRRHMMPRPKCLEVFEAQATASSETLDTWRFWLTNNLTHVADITEATEACEIDKAVDFGLVAVDRSALLKLGIGNVARLRRGGKKSKSRYYRVCLNGVWGPAQLKPRL